MCEISKGPLQERDRVRARARDKRKERERDTHYNKEEQFFRNWKVIGVKTHG